MGWLSARKLFVLALIGWIAIAILGVASGHSLGHDEAAYAVLARDGHDAWIYRSDGMVAIAQLGLLWGGAEWQLRVLPALLGAGSLCAVYLVGKVALSAQTAAWAALVLAGASPMALRASALLSDLPSMGCLLGGMAVLLAELRRAERGDDQGSSRGLRWQILWAAPLFAASFYIRYGSAPTVMIIALLPVVVWWPILWRRPAPFLTMLALLGSFVAPHLLRSLWATGSPLGILEMSAEVSGRAYVGDGLVTYLTSNPFLYYGVLVAPLMILGLARPFWRGRQGASPETSRRSWDARIAVYLALVAVAQLVVLGLQSHAEARYVYVASSSLVLLGVDLLRRSALARPRAAMGALVIAGAAWALTALMSWPHFSRLDEDRAAIVATARAMRSHAAGEGCTAISRKAPQLVWYSGCAPLTIPRGDHSEDHLIYVASFAKRPLSVSDVLQPGQRACPLRAPDAGVELWRLDDHCAPL